MPFVTRGCGDCLIRSGIAGRRNESQAAHYFCGWACDGSGARKQPRGQNGHPGRNSHDAIGYPYHGLLTSDFNVTTGIVSSLSGILNDTHHLQISAAVQPGNSGGPLFDLGGAVVGVVASKLDAVRMARATGSIPENINFAIKTGALRDFLDNSAVMYRTAEWRDGTKKETSDIAKDARGYTLLITCTVTEQSANAKRGK